MADTNSFDVVSEVDFAEVKNAANQAEKEILTRYDLKRVGSKLLIEDETLVLESADDFTLEQAREVVETKLVRRGVHLKSMRRGDIEPASGGRVRQKITWVMAGEITRPLGRPARCHSAVPRRNTNSSAAPA